MAGTPTTSPFTIRGLTDGRAYSVQVCSQFADGTPASPTACAEGQGSRGLPNQPPVVDRQIQNIEIGIGQVATVPLAGTFSNPDPGDSLTYTVTSSVSAVATATEKVDDVTIEITGKSAGTTRVTVVATDSKGGTASQTFEVTVTPEPVNQPPVAGPVQLPAVELGIGQSHTIAVARTFTDPEDDRIDFVDPTTSRPTSRPSQRSRMVRSS